jgi:uncharacterized damage-inducible protein DinB
VKKTGSMLEMIKMFYAYNSWATSQLINSLDQLNSEKLTATGCSGHGSIRETLAHFLGTQWGWFSWFDKSLTAQESITLRVSAQEVGSLEKIRQKWQSIDKQTNNCLDRLKEAGVNEIWKASFPNGFSMALPLWQLLLHVANHGTHTRAQIVAAVRRFGHEPGIYEFFRFALSQS